MTRLVIIAVLGLLAACERVVELSPPDARGNDGGVPSSNDAEGTDGFGDDGGAGLADAPGGDGGLDDAAPIDAI